jgi:hypothetical protein
MRAWRSDAVICQKRASRSSSSRSSTSSRKSGGTSPAKIEVVARDVERRKRKGEDGRGRRVCLGGTGMGEEVLWKGRVGAGVVKKKERGGGIRIGRGGGRRGIEGGWSLRGSDSMSTLMLLQEGRGVARR